MGDPKFWDDDLNNTWTNTLNGIPYACVLNNDTKVLTVLRTDTAPPWVLERYPANVLQRALDRAEDRVRDHRSSCRMFGGVVILDRLACSEEEAQVALAYTINTAHPSATVVDYALAEGLEALVEHANQRRSG